MRFVDAILRRGHLSERALADVCMTGERPAHLDRCDICAARAVQLGRWLEDVRAIGIEEADAAFPAERLAAQQAQILRRLEQLDRPARVIAFPGPSKSDRLELSARGIRPAWVAVAAAAGIVIGVFGGQLGNRLLTDRAAGPPRPAVETQPPAAAPAPSTPAMAHDLAPPLDLDEYERPQIEAVRMLDEWTPHMISRSDVVRTVRVNR